MKPIIQLLLMTALISSPVSSNSQSKSDKPYNNRILVVGGGGARGAWGAGLAKYLSMQYGPYRYAFGTSTGSLMAPLLVLNDFDKLKQAYTSVTQKDIFNVNPFNEKTGNLKGLKAIWRLLSGKQSFGESKNLRNLIDKFLSDEEYSRIVDPKNDLMFAVTVLDMNSGDKEIKYSKDFADPKEMKNWIWASGNEPLFMSYYNVGEAAYVDGGIRENVPVMAALAYAIERKIYEIDVIVNKPQNPLVNTGFKKRGVLKGLGRLVDIWTTEVKENDILLALLAARAECCKPDPGLINEQEYHINVYYFPEDKFKDLNQKELLFDKARMTDLWNIGESGPVHRLARDVITLPESVLNRVLKNSRFTQ